MHAVRDHERAVDTLRRSYAAVPAGEPVRLAKQTSNLFRPRSAPRTPGLDVSGLTGVLAVDPAARTADVQGMCTYEDLVDATLPHGLMPLVVPQLRTITLGGAVVGLSGTCPVVTFTVDGRAVATSPATTYKGGSCGKLKDGETIIVRGTEAAAGGVDATEVEFDK